MKEIEEQESKGGKKAKIPDGFVDDMVGLMKLFIFAGHDTTAINLSFAFHFIQRDPTVLAKLKEEFDAVFGTDVAAVGDILRQSPQLVNSLPYTTAVLKETLRMCPGMWLNFVCSEPEESQRLMLQNKQSHPLTANPSRISRCATPRQTRCCRPRASCS